jgi:hypothetical protein
MQKFNPYYYIRIKENIPFSQKLNDFINDWFELRKDTFVFTDRDNFNENDIEGTFKLHKKIYRETNKIYIWSGASDNTIFGDAETNLKFRAWHDFIHINYNLGYSITEESVVCDIQRDMLPFDWNFEKKLIESEIRGQAHYFYRNNKFVGNQRKFTIDWLTNSINALNNNYDK